MYRCLQLAALGMPTVAPNPMVGAVLVYNNSIIGEGFHQKFGEAHAEINCINSVRATHAHLIAQSTLYVSLEPCAHFGKTPPCTNIIIAHQIKKVIIACVDIFSEVNGAGIAKLKAAGIEVITDVLKDEAIDLNKRFFAFHKTKMPYVILKWAQTGNHKVAGLHGAQINITNHFSNVLVHKWRSEESAIMVGKNTALLDNPALTTRLWKGKNPVRVVIDRALALPAHLNLFDGKVHTIVYNHKKNNTGKNLTYCMLADTPGFLQQVLSDLYNRGVNSVIVEGGTSLLNAFITLNLWNEARVFTNTAMQIEGIDAPVFDGLKPSAAHTIDSDLVQFYFNENM